MQNPRIQSHIPLDAPNAYEAIRRIAGEGIARAAMIYAAFLRAKK